MCDTALAMMALAMMACCFVGLVWGCVILGYWECSCVIFIARCCRGEGTPALHVPLSPLVLMEEKQEK